MKSRKEDWWRRAVIYEIAPISFQDTNGDGKGDLKGIERRVDYLQWLGIDAVWLTPFFVSPMQDFGYDIADYCAVDPDFGTLEDFDRLVEMLHRHDIRLILDYVPNHTSDQHAWFIDSRSSRQSAKRDWYVWADPAPNGGPPNNWLSRFGGSAWRWDEKTGQYYYHSFLTGQPDLNWRNAEVRAAMAEVLRFWMRRGVDGFRVDASAVLIEDALLRDDPVDPEAGESKPPPQRLKRIFSDDRRESMSCIEDIRKVIDEFDGRLLCGEVQGKIDRIGHFYGNDHPRLHLPLNFSLLDSCWDALSLQGTIDAYLNAIPEKAWPDWVIGGHDKHRAASKTGQAQARILAMLCLTLYGTPFFFAGDELGMERADIPKEAVHDPFEKLVPGYGLNRDPERVPMPWDTTKHHGFTTGEPWLPMSGIKTRSVAELQKDERSILHLYKALLALRRATPALRCGDYAPLRSRNEILCYQRFTDQEKFTIALNLTHDARRLEEIGEGDIVLSTWLDRREVPLAPDLLLRPDEGIIVRMR
ncbi:MAG TPA: alpha-amylase family glycosyl hydrolase [Bradyrhizobium sp.]|nr:alpha-amylase family glycosyl hydrolase [Bradyrhizobium sp.]